MADSTFSALPGGCRPRDPVPVWPVWELQGHGSASGLGGLPPWFTVRLTFADGARVDLLAAIGEHGVLIEDLRAEPALSMTAFAALADRIAEPLQQARRAVAERLGVAADEPRPAPPGPAPGGVPVRRARRGRRRGRGDRRGAAAADVAAQRVGADPVLAVMWATGHGRRTSLRLIAAARDDGYLSPRHARRS